MNSSPFVTPTAEDNLPAYRQVRWRVAGFLAVASALNYADRAAMSAVLPAVRADLGLSDVQLGLLGSVFLWTYALGSPFAGSIADRISRRKLVVVSLLAWSAVTALVAVVSDFGFLVALRAGLGIAECLFLPAAFALIAYHHTPVTRARAMSFISIGLNCGMVLGGSFAGYLAEKFGWRSGFAVFGLLGIALALFSRPFLPPPAHDAAAVIRTPFLVALKYLARVPTYYALVIESTLSGMGMWIFFSWLPLYFRDTYKMSLAGAGFAGTFMLQVSVMIGLTIGGWVSDRAAAKAPERRMRAYGTCYLLAAPFLLFFLDQPAFPVLATAITIFSFLRGVGQANDHPTLTEIVPQHLRSTAIGVMNGCATASGGCGVFLAGYLKREVGLGTVFAGISVSFLIAGVVLLVAYRFFAGTDIARARAAE